MNWQITDLDKEEKPSRWVVQGTGNLISIGGKVPPICAGTSFVLCLEKLRYKKMRHEKQA